MTNATATTTTTDATANTTSACDTVVVCMATAPTWVLWQTRHFSTYSESYLGEASSEEEEASIIATAAAAKARVIAIQDEGGGWRRYWAVPQTGDEWWGICLRQTAVEGLFPTADHARAAIASLADAAEAASQSVKEYDDRPSESNALWSVAYYLRQAMIESTPVYRLRDAVAWSQRVPIHALRPLRSVAYLEAVVAALE